MERLILEDMIKALKCVGSQDSLGDCYADREVYMHMEDENHKRLVCGTGKDLYIKGIPTEGCPYYQKKYGVCPEDGDLYWLNEVAELLEELKSYKDAEEQGLLVRLPCKVGDTVWVVTSPINVFSYSEYDGDAEHEVYESFLSSVSYYTSGEQFRIYAKVTNSFIAAYFRECDFGKSIFLTREEAEKKLEESQNDKT